MARCFLALGSNLVDPLKQAIAARQTLAASQQLTLVKSSSLYQSRPMGPQDQPDYLNAVFELDTELTPLELLNLTQKIELEQGRQRKDERWGPRTLDLDILLYGNQIIDTPRLTVPHYGMKQREFVLLPLAEIAADLHLPDQSLVQQLAASIDSNGLQIFKRPADWA
ncbi:2-amino-4-hydroxy-6-hydroxymethyldihydropteridine diphosphokinase [Agarivorans sp. 1_MG-2023]|uniref:2-amino-4-hydroxy-6- hydroxymethyldihydropteridine diphosphokinase n=1 Tax=Agarivorans sp. 1_MG-2023 TaxID=3062634 RepID=UPI0026E17EFA|nr:2-amino-4-hydroxy-6-hydroxymethyldihydropteridine diphosphokinase [Agarivorans sp. 1_MG-2023]MDO6763604.1 2-amino-4-hydroxy-6-hydroxymethyldihydropteridine diphosphokinase [Agarivorans sp. 1_MG-2023]